MEEAKAIPTRILQEWEELTKKEKALIIQKEQMETYAQDVINRYELGKKGIDKLTEEINGIELDNELKERTIDNKVKESSLTLQNLMAEILLKGSQRKVNEEQAKAIPAKILQGWEELTKKGKALIIQKEQMEAYAQDVINRYELGKKA